MSDKFPGGLITANAPAGFSVAFDGTGDYLTTPSSANLGFGNVFTVEYWLYLTGAPTGANAAYAVDFRSGSTNNYAFGVIASSGSTILYGFVGSGNGEVRGTTALSLNTWYHCAFVNNGTTMTGYLNGVSQGTYSTSFSQSTTSAVIGARFSGATEYINGYISNLRVLNGTSLYTTTFTPPTQLFPITNTQLLTCQSPTIIDNSSNAFTITVTGDAKVSNFTPFAAYQGFNPALGAAAGGVWTLDEAAYYQQNRLWPIYDPYFKNTTLMLHGNGTNAAQNNTFLDSSTNNFTITRNGNTTQGSFSPFSQTGWSNYFNGSTDYLSVPSSANLAIGTGDYTLEAWLYMSSTSFSNQCFYGGTSSGGPIFTIRSQTSLVINPYGSGDTCTFTGAYFPTNQWYHIAVTRQSSTARLFVNGVLASTTTDSGNYGQTVVGVGGIGLYYWTGYVSNLRFIKGTAVYTSSFTPSTTPLTAVTGTQLLTSQSQRFVDNSANNFAITANSTPSVQAFSPFVPAYITPTTYSNWFDGSGDYLTAPNNAAFSLASDFTIECEWYPNDLSASSNVWCLGDSRSANNGLLLYWSSGSGKLLVYSNGSALITSSINTPASAWYHLAVVRSGSGSNNLTLYINGISAGTATNTTSFVSVAANGFAICAEYAGSYSAGKSSCISNLRVVNGTALYTAAFTPPTAPLTNITNTSLLTCQSSTFIDNSTNNFAITATGNVQPVTSPTPFPAKVDTTTLNSAYSTSLIGGSGYFDGTGDYLATGTASALDNISGNFTIEYWQYPLTGGSALSPVLGSANSGFSGTASFFAFEESSNKLLMFLNATQASSLISYTAPTKLTNNWAHVAWVRSGSVITLYLNGAAAATVTYTSTISLNTTNSKTYVGRNGWDAYYWLGYISGLRVVKGTALYTSAFAPPINTIYACH